MNWSLSSLSRPALCALVGITVGVVIAGWTTNLWAIPVTVGFVTIVEAVVEAVADMLAEVRSDQGVES